MHRFLWYRYGIDAWQGAGLPLEAVEPARPSFHPQP